MSFSERVEKLDREIGATFERALGTLRRDLSERLRASNEQLLQSIAEIKPELPSRLLADEHVAPFAQEATGTARHGAFAELRDAVAEIDSARSQAAILSALLASGRRFASRTAILISRGDQIQGWGAQGFGGDEQAIRGLTIDAAADGADTAHGAATVWARLSRGEGAMRLSAAECADLCSRLESPLPHDGVLVPLILRNQLAAMLYADRLDGADLMVEGLQTLAYVASQAIESLPFRERAATATLRLADQPTAASAATAEPAESAEPAHAAAAAEPEAPAAEASPAAAPEPPPQASAAEASATEASATEAAAAAPEAGEATESEAPTPAPEPEPQPAATPSAWARTQEVRSVDEPTAGAPEPRAEAAGPAETVLLPRVAFASAPAPAPSSEPAEPDEVTQAGGPRAVPAGGFAEPAGPDAARGAASSPTGNPEVRPPTGVQGPGWAFATTRVNVAADDEALHEEARRLARLLVSEIKLYNEEQVEEGRRNRDLYERLKDDIDRSRQMYEERVEPRVLRSTDYFYQELVRILAAGDSKALGI
jgi:hypothetical protein